MPKPRKQWSILYCCIDRAYKTSSSPDPSENAAAAVLRGLDRLAPELDHVSVTALHDVRRGGRLTDRTVHQTGNRSKTFEDFCGLSSGEATSLPETVLAYLKAAIKNAPADHTIVFFTGHGFGEFGFGDKPDLLALTLLASHFKTDLDGYLESSEDYREKSVELITDWLPNLTADMSLRADDEAAVTTKKATEFVDRLFEVGPSLVEAYHHAAPGHIAYTTSLDFDKGVVRAKKPDVQDSLTILRLREVIRDFITYARSHRYSASTGRIDMLGFEACDMSTVEVAYDLGDLCKHIVASPIRFFSGFPHTSWIAGLDQYPGTFGLPSFAIATAIECDDHLRSLAIASMFVAMEPRLRKNLVARINNFVRVAKPLLKNDTFRDHVTNAVEASRWDLSERDSTTELGEREVSQVGLMWSVFLPRFFGDLESRLSDPAFQDAKTAAHAIARMTVFPPEDGDRNCIIADRSLTTNNRLSMGFAAEDGMLTLYFPDRADILDRYETSSAFASISDWPSFLRHYFQKK
ncbi:clostripain-related cysteine peptidase [Stratiformator vulcanicus]|uniref:Clostripain family protein n=1 Tax=Stratiformator vulcanicus TaxID=2527980 RepID=A0A517QYG2_9PLAN|nr:clostripain-related cysteine peptidase [Stratiformator vulcanicus]QDT36634.1 Clostripain family protein [Stratiformator vulcanicus]